MSLLSFFHGFWLGFGLIVAIGAQNAFLLKQGLLRQHVFLLCLVASLCDSLLIILGVAGFGSFIRSQPFLIDIVKYGGVVFLSVYGLLAFWRAYNSDAMNIDSAKSSSLKVSLLTLLAFTFLNPHVYLDTVILLGAVSLSYVGFPLLLFTIGSCTASCLWFFLLGYGARTLAPLFSREVSWRILDIFIGFVMISLAFLVLYQ